MDTHASEARKVRARRDFISVSLVRLNNDAGSFVVTGESCPLRRLSGSI
jgi:hypothetical protein